MTYQQHKDKNICRLSMELLDTEDTHSEDPVEVEKWNEYVEKFVGSEEVSLEVKDHLQSKPIFLPRYVFSYTLKAQKQKVDVHREAFPMRRHNKFPHSLC